MILSGAQVGKTQVGKTQVGKTQVGKTQVGKTRRLKGYFDRIAPVFQGCQLPFRILFAISDTVCRRNFVNTNSKSVGEEI